MNVKVTLVNGSMWHDGKVYTNGSVIMDMPDEVALRGINNGELAEVRHYDADMSVDLETGEISEVDDEEITQEMVAEADAKIDIGAFLAGTVAREPDTDDEPADGDETLEPDTYEPASSVDDAVTSILGHIEPKPKTKPARGPEHGRK